MSVQAYYIDAFPVAANTVVRSIMAGTLPLAAPRLYAALGVGWGNTLLGFLGLATVPVPVVLLACGEGIRRRGRGRWRGIFDLFLLQISVML